MSAVSVNSAFLGLLTVSAMSDGNRGILGRQSPSQFWQFRTANSAICVSKTGNLCKFGNFSSIDMLSIRKRHSRWSRHPCQSRQSLELRRSRPAISEISAATTLPACSLVNLFNLVMFFFAFSARNSAISIYPAISGDTVGDLGCLDKICILGNPTNLGSACNIGWQSRQSRPAVSVAISAISDCNFGNIGTLSNPGNLGILG